MRSIILALLFALVSTGLPAGEEPAFYDRVDLSVRAVKEVANDTLTAVMYKESEGSDPERLSSEVNRTIADALTLARQYPVVEAQTLDYRTTPVYRNKVVAGWRVRQSVSLKSMDADVLGALIGKLQSRLSLGGVGYAVSSELQAETEALLIDDAIKRFSERASQVAKALGRADYRLVRMGIETNARAPRLRQMGMMATAEQASPPVFESGTQPIEVGISGTIELSN